MMSVHHLHLILLHFPIAGVGACIVVLVWALLRRSQETTRLALVGVVVTMALAWLTAATGEGAEDAVEALPGIHEAAIDAHEHAAQLAAILLSVAAAAATASWIASFRFLVLQRWSSWLTVLLLLVAAAGMVDAGRTGGAIRHPEILGSG